MAWRASRSSSGAYAHWSDDGIEIKYGRRDETFRWSDLKTWRETDDLVILYGRKKFLDMSGPCIFDVIDLNQVSEEEKRTFREMLSAKVKQTV